MNPCKLYLAEYALAAAYNPLKTSDRGHCLKNIVARERLQRNSSLAYVKTVQGHEVDFLAPQTDGDEIKKDHASLRDANPHTLPVRLTEGRPREVPRNGVFLAFSRVSFERRRLAQTFNSDFGGGLL